MTPFVTLIILFLDGSAMGIAYRGADACAAGLITEPAKISERLGLEVVEAYCVEVRR
ncbi:MAG: hypothetical protein ACU0CT_02600 [Paracoccaceae bacterium]